MGVSGQGINSPSERLVYVPQLFTAICHVVRQPRVLKSLGLQTKNPRRLWSL